MELCEWQALTLSHCVCVELCEWQALTLSHHYFAGFEDVPSSPAIIWDDEGKILAMQVRAGEGGGRGAMQVREGGGGREGGTPRSSTKYFGPAWPDALGRGSDHQQGNRVPSEQ